MYGHLCGRRETSTGPHVEAGTVQRAGDFKPPEPPRGQRLARMTALAVYRVKATLDMTEQHVHTSNLQQGRLPFTEIGNGYGWCHELSPAASM